MLVYSACTLLVQCLNAVLVWCLRAVLIICCVDAAVDVRELGEAYDNATGGGCGGILNTKVAMVTPTC